MAVPKVYTRREACAVLRIGITKLKELISSGELPVRRVGRRVLITEEAIREFLREGRVAA